VRDELGVTEVARARPLQAALASGASFSAGAALPVLVALLAPLKDVVPIVAGSSLVFLTLLGAFGARVGGAPVLRASGRTALLGALAMGAAAAVGKLFGVAA
jgi:VIT1/CCC1 family predicted Fe2+/Mn2+ transporter